MGKVKNITPPSEDTPVSFAHSLEVRESQCIALAYDLVEQRLREGTATSQETTHFLRMGSTKELRDRKLDEMELELKAAKKEAIEAARRVEELYKDAIMAVQTYRSPAIQDIQMEDRHD